MTRNIVLALSGGMDSSALLGKCRAVYTDANILTIFFSYGSKHNEYEWPAAQAVADHYKVPIKFVDLTQLSKVLKSDLLLSGGAIPEGHYEAKSMKQTVVPGRNSIFASILAGACESLGGGKVLMGVHAGDHAIYPDCRPMFVTAMGGAIASSTENRVFLEAPFLYLSKGQIVGQGLELGVPFNLTRTCYKNQPIACGKCGSCNERREAFAQNNVTDPVEYEYTGPMPEKPSAST